MLSSSNSSSAAPAFCGSQQPEHPIMTSFYAKAQDDHMPIIIPPGFFSSPTTDSSSSVHQSIATHEVARFNGIEQPRPPHGLLPRPPGLDFSKMNLIARPPGLLPIRTGPPPGLALGRHSVPRPIDNGAGAVTYHELELASSPPGFSLPPPGLYPASPSIDNSVRSVTSPSLGSSDCANSFYPSSSSADEAGDINSSGPSSFHSQKNIHRLSPSSGSIESSDSEANNNDVQQKPTEKRAKKSYAPSFLRQFRPIKARYFDFSDDEDEKSRHFAALTELLF